MRYVFRKSCGMIFVSFFLKSFIAHGLPKYSKLGYVLMAIYIFNLAQGSRHEHMTCRFNVNNRNLNVKMCDFIWNHHEKCIQLSTNMSSIGLAII